MAHPLFTDEHEMLRRSIHAFVEKEIAPRVAEWETAGRIPRELWRRLGELGFLGLEFETEYGGSGAAFLPRIVLAAGMGREAAPPPPHSPDPESTRLDSHHRYQSYDRFFL